MNSNQRKIAEDIGRRVAEEAFRRRNADDAPTEKEQAPSGAPIPSNPPQAAASYNEGVALYQKKAFKQAISAFDACAESDTYRIQAAYARAVCQEQLGIPVQIPPDLAERADEVGPIAVANNLAWHLVKEGRESRVVKEGSTSEVEVKIDGVVYLIQITGLFGSFSNWVFRIEGGKDISIADPDAWPHPSASDRLAISLAENAGSLPLSPIPSLGPPVVPREGQPQHETAFFEMPVNDVFNIAGKGTVVTGRVARGYLRKGDRITLVQKTGNRRDATCVGIEIFRKLVEIAETGADVGLLIQGITPEQVQSGDVVISDAGRQASAPSQDTVSESEQTTSFDNELLACLKAGQPVQAIKLRREKTGEGLKEAHDAVDRLARSHGLPPLASQLKTSSRCLIATAACGIYSAEVLELRYYRDTVMRDTIIGRATVRFYDFVSPPLARLVASSPAARSCVREFLVKPLARAIQKRNANNGTEPIR